MEKSPKHNLLETLFLPCGITDPNLLAIVRGIVNRLPITISIWAIAGVIFWQTHLYASAWTQVFYTGGSLASLLILKMGHVVLFRIFYLVVLNISVGITWLLLGWESFFWVAYLINISMIYIITLEAEKNIRRALLGSSWFCLLLTVTILIFKLVPAEVTQQNQQVPFLVGNCIVAFALLHLMVAIARHRRETLMYKTRLEKQSLGMLQQARMSSLGEMAGGVAHEINNPLAMINGHLTQMLREIEAGRGNSEKVIEKCKRSLDTITRISKIIMALRTFSRDTDEDPFQNASWSEILENTLSFCGEKLNQHQVNLRILGEQAGHLECRPSQISQVLVNLISNSFDAIKNLPEKWIEIDTNVTANSITIAVTDSGHGIAAEAAGKIMEPFFTTKELGKGTGLGLSVSKGIIETHGGNITLDRSCANTRFVITLPTQQGSELALPPHSKAS